MVQERDFQPRKIQAEDLDRNLDPRFVDRSPDPRSVPPVRYENSGTPVTDMASGLALLLSIIAFFLSCYAAIQVGRRTPTPVRSPGTANQSSQPVSRPVLPFLSKAQAVKPGLFIEPTQDKSGEVELLSATRASDKAATIQLRVRRLDRPTSGMTPIDLPKTIALNTRTNERYPILDYRTPNEFLTMSELRPGSSMNATITVRVPENLDRIDLDIPNVRVFRNVPIS